MARVLMVSEPFGYGPTGSLMLCRSQLDQSGLDFRYAGPSFAQDIVDEEHFEACYYLQMGDDLKSHLTAPLQWADVVICPANIEIARLATEAGCRVVVLDPLFWFWPNVPPFNTDGMIYLCPNFTGVVERVVALPDSIRHQFRVLPPPILQRKSKPLDSPSTVLVNLCGLINSIQTLSGYVAPVVEPLMEALRDNGWEKIICVGGGGVANQLLDENGPKFEVLRHEAMLTSIAQADLFVTCPGINSAMEGLGLGVPIVFLPPQNASQAFQRSAFVDGGAATPDLDWDSFTDFDSRWTARPESEVLNAIGRAISLVDGSPALRHYLRQALTRATRCDADHLANIAAGQLKFREALRSTATTAFSEVAALLGDRG